MSARLPIQNKSPFEIDPRPLNETASPHAGLLATSRAFRSLKVPDLIAANLSLKQRQRGFAEAQFIETVLLPKPSVEIAPKTSSCWSATRAWNGAWVLRCLKFQVCVPSWNAF